MRKIALLLPALMLATSAFAQTAPAMTKPATTMPGKMTPSKTGMPMTPMAKVAVNTATEAQLAALPGVGPKLAAEMIKSRPFKNSADLIKRVKGIGPKNYVKLGLNKELTF